MNHGKSAPAFWLCLEGSLGKQRMGLAGLPGVASTDSDPSWFLVLGCLINVETPDGRNPFGCTPNRWFINQYSYCFSIHFVLSIRMGLASKKEGYYNGNHPSTARKHGCLPLSGFTHHLLGPFKVKFRGDVQSKVNEIGTHRVFFWFFG